jgi:ornithine cyclodeaminase
MALTVIDAATVRRLLPVGECIDVMREAMIALSCGEVQVPPRTIAPLADGSGYLLAMPGSAAKDLGIDGAKLLTLLPGNVAQGRPAIQGVVLLFDHAGGAPVALIEGSEITAIRTAAVSGLATRLLAREDARTHGVLGTGVQARMHIDAITAARPGIREVLVWGRNPESARTLAATQRERCGLAVRAVPHAAEACACDVVSATTASPRPVLQGAWLAQGAHVNLVGGHQRDEREADSAALTRAAVYVDLLPSALAEAGDILIPMHEGCFGPEHIVGEIGQLAAGTVAGRRSAAQVTLFKSLGVVAEDLYAAAAVWRRAVQQGIGTTVPF